MSIGSFKRENLEFLVACHGTQTEFANALHHNTLTQPIISSIIRKKRTFHSHEARAIEQWLCISEGWIDRYPLLTFRKAWAHLKKLRHMEPDTVRTLHALVKFADQNSKA